MTVFVLALPLWFALSGAVSTAAAAIVHAGRVANARIVSCAQLGAVLLAIAVLLTAGVTSSALWRFGLPATPLWLALGVIVGVLCIPWEIAVSRVITMVPGWRWRMMSEGNTPTLLSLPLRGSGWVALGVGFAVAEEILWRGLAAQVLLAAGWPELSAVAVLSILFGVNHGWFGLRSVLAKTGEGLAWASLTIGSGSLYPAIAAHVVFQLLVLRRLNRQRGSADPRPLPADDMEPSGSVPER